MFGWQSNLKELQIIAVSLHLNKNDDYGEQKTSDTDNQ